MELVLHVAHDRRVSAPLTAGFGLLVAYLINRQRFAGKGAFEFVTLLSFAMPGTVVGIAYILAFNAPPIELAYTGIILVACFVFRDMTTSLRAGLASLRQIDGSLDEASATLRAGSFRTLRRVRPAADCGRPSSRRWSTASSAR